MFKEIDKVAASGNGMALIYTAGIAAILGDLVPTPADALYFVIEKKLRDQWKAGKISPKQYWLGEAAAYYGLNPIWWALILFITVNIKGDFEQKMKVGFAIMGSGVVVGVLLKNIKADTRQIASLPPTKW